MHASIPAPLPRLSPAEILAFRPFDIRNGNYARMPQGYSKKTGYFHISRYDMSIAKKIENLQNDESRQHCKAAYDYLMSSNASCYSDFITLHQQLVNEQKQPNILDFRMMEGIKCALWLHLYPYISKV